MLYHLFWTGQDNSADELYGVSFGLDRSADEFCTVSFGLDRTVWLINCMVSVLDWTGPFSDWHVLMCFS
jgi:hypothetical protein